jgi:hypothetical protein
MHKMNLHVHMGMSCLVPIDENVSLEALLEAVDDR